MASFKLSNVCRLCLARCDRMINIYEIIDGNGVLIADLIKDLLQVKVCRTDGYSHYVCNLCMEKVTGYKLFKDQCLQAMATYASMLYGKGCTLEIRYPTLVANEPLQIGAIQTYNIAGFEVNDAPAHLYQEHVSFSEEPNTQVASKSSEIDMDETPLMSKNELQEQQQPIPNHTQEDATEYILPCRRTSSVDLSLVKNSALEDTHQVNYGPIHSQQELTSFNKDANVQDGHNLREASNEEENVEYIVPSPCRQELETDFSSDEKPKKEFSHQSEPVEQVTAICPEEADEYIVPSPTRQELDSISLKSTVTKETPKNIKVRPSLEEIISSSSSDSDFRCSPSELLSSEDEYVCKRKRLQRKAKRVIVDRNTSKEPVHEATKKKNDVLNDENNKKKNRQRKAKSANEDRNTSKEPAHDATNKNNDILGDENKTSEPVEQVTAICPEEADEYIVPSPTRQELDSISLKSTVTKETPKNIKVRPSLEEIISSSSSDSDFRCSPSELLSSEDEYVCKRKRLQRKAKRVIVDRNTSKEPVHEATKKKNDVLNDENNKKKNRQRKAKSANEDRNTSKESAHDATNKNNDILGDENKTVSIEYPRVSIEKISFTKHTSSSRQVIYHCNKCDGMFKNKIELLHHELRHQLLKQLTCENCNKKFPNGHELFQHRISQCVYGIPDKGETIPKGRSSIAVHDASFSEIKDPQFNGTSLKVLKMQRIGSPCNDSPVPVKTKLSGPVEMQTNISCQTASTVSGASSNASETAFPVTSIHESDASSACITEEGVSMTDNIKAAVSGSFVPMTAVCGTDSPFVSITKENIPGMDILKSVVSETDSLVVSITKENIPETIVSKPADSETDPSTAKAMNSGTDASRMDESMEYEDVSILNEGESTSSSLNEKKSTELLNTSLKNVPPKKTISTVESLQSKISLVLSDDKPKNVINNIDQKQEEMKNLSSTPPLEGKLDYLQESSTMTKECSISSLDEKEPKKSLWSSLRNVRLKRKISTEKSLQSEIPLVSSDNQPKNMDPVNQKEVEKTEFLCTECGKIFKYYSNLYNHMKIHGASKKHCCKICKKTFLHKHHLVQHETTHDESKLFRCPICNKTFKMDFLLTSHQEKIHGIIKRFECTVCGESFKGKGGLEHHTKRKHEEKQIFQCDTCGLKAPNKGTLRKHLGTHSSERRHKCDVCGKAFKRSSTLNRHYLIHSDSKNFSCNQCGRSFTQKGALVAHMTSHSDVRAFSCDICQKKFKDKNTMKDHKETHNTELRYSCKVCSKKFAGRKQMMKHVRGIHRV